MSDTQSIVEKIAAQNAAKLEAGQNKERPTLVPVKKIMTTRRNGFQMGDKIIRADVRGVLPEPQTDVEKAEYKQRLAAGIFFEGEVYEEAPATPAATK